MHYIVLCLGYGWNSTNAFVVAGKIKRMEVCTVVPIGAVALAAAVLLFVSIYYCEKFILWICKHVLQTQNTLMESYHILFTSETKES